MVPTFTASDVTATMIGSAVVQYSATVHDDERDEQRGSACHGAHVDRGA